MDQSQIQQQLLADTPLDKLHLSFTETCELLLQQNSGILKDLQDSHAQDGTEMKSAKRLHLKANDASLHITLDLVTPHEPRDGQPTYLIFSVADVLTNLTQLIVQNGQTYTRLVYNEALEDMSQPPDKVIDEPANRTTMISAVMRLNSVEPVHEDLLMLQLPQINVPPLLSVAPMPEQAPATESPQPSAPQHHDEPEQDNTMAHAIDMGLPKPSAPTIPNLGRDQGEDAVRQDSGVESFPQLRPAPAPTPPPLDMSMPPPPPQPAPMPPLPQMSPPAPSFGSTPTSQTPRQEPSSPPPSFPSYQPVSPMGAPSMMQPPPQTVSPSMPSMEPPGGPMPGMAMGQSPGQGYGQPPQQQQPTMFSPQQPPPPPPGQAPGPGQAPPSPGSFFQLPQ